MKIRFILIAVCFLFSLPGQADEGMWMLGNLNISSQTGRTSDFSTERLFRDQHDRAGRGSHCLRIYLYFSGKRVADKHNFDLLLAQLLEAAGISDEFSAYARRADARPILFDKK